MWLYHHGNKFVTAGRKDITKIVIFATRQLVIITTLVINLRLLSNKFIFISHFTMAVKSHIVTDGDSSITGLFWVQNWKILTSEIVKFSETPKSIFQK